ncbi:MAG TPA: hypothetical protein VFP60_03655 [Pseudolabrys sp.]|nr:hypothetical protein [Pseudolabrys sp.]
MFGASRTHACTDLRSLPEQDEILAVESVVLSRIIFPARGCREVTLAQSQSADMEVGETFGAMREKAEHIAEAQKDAGAERLAGMAKAVHEAADDLAKEMPQAATAPMYTAADALEGLATQLREKSIGDLASTFSTMASKQPVASFAACILAGFALTHFLKSSSQARQ